MAFTVSFADEKRKSSLSVVKGLHFYADNNLVRTMIARWAERMWSPTVTNAEHLEAESLLHRMIFHKSRHLDQATNSLHPAIIEEKLDRNDSTGGSEHGYMATNSLIYMLLCFDMFSQLNRNDTTPPLPDTFVGQQWNARAVAFDLYQSVKNEGGVAWDSLCQLFDEMDDRLLNGDDVISPIRQLISKAQKLPPLIRGIRPNVYHPRFDTQRRNFYANAQHRTVLQKKFPGGPATLYSWSNVAENTVKAEVDPDTRRLVVFRPNHTQTRYLEGAVVTTPFVTQPPKEWSVGRQFNQDVIVCWREKIVVDVREVFQNRERENPGWLDQLVGGAPDDTTGWWIGTLSNDV